MHPARLFGATVEATSSSLALNDDSLRLAQIRAIESESAARLKALELEEIRKEEEFKEKQERDRQEFRVKRERDNQIFHDESQAKQQQVAEEQRVRKADADARVAEAKARVLDAEAQQDRLRTEKAKALSDSLADGSIDECEYRQRLAELMGLPAGEVSIRDFITKTLRGEARVVAAVEREARWSVEAGEHPKPRWHRDRLDRILWFAASDGDFLRSLYEHERDRRAGVDASQRRLM